MTLTFKNHSLEKQSFKLSPLASKILIKMLTPASKTCASKDLAIEVMNKKEKQLCKENTFS